MDVKVTGRNGVDWIHLALDRDNYRDVLNVVMTLLNPKQSGKFREKLQHTGFRCSGI